MHGQSYDHAATNILSIILKLSVCDFDHILCCKWFFLFNNACKIRDYYEYLKAKGWNNEQNFGNYR